MFKDYETFIHFRLSEDGSMARLAVSGSGRSVAVTGSGHTVQVIGKHQDGFFLPE